MPIYTIALWPSRGWMLLKYVSLWLHDFICCVTEASCIQCHNYCTFFTYFLHNFYVVNWCFPDFVLGLHPKKVCIIGVFLAFMVCWVTQQASHRSIGVLKCDI